jgi:hypothetical protein
MTESHGHQGAAKVSCVGDSPEFPRVSAILAILAPDENLLQHPDVIGECQSGQAGGDA